MSQVEFLRRKQCEYQMILMLENDNLQFNHSHFEFTYQNHMQQTNVNFKQCLLNSALFNKVSYYVVTALLFN